MFDGWEVLSTNDHGDTIDESGRIVNEDGTEPHGVVIEKECAETGCKADIYRETIKRLEKRNLDLASDVGELSAKVITERERADNAEYALKSEHGQLMAAQNRITALEQAIDGRAKVSEYQGSLIHALEKIVKEARKLPDHWRREASRGFVNKTTIGVINLCAAELEQALAENPVAKPLET